jgi:hypothetical protein
MRRLVSWVVLLCVVAPALADEPAYTIKLKTYPDKGQVISCREVDKQSSTIRFITPDGKVIKEDTPSEESEEISTLEVLEPGERAPAHYRQIFGKAMFSGSRDKKRSYESLAIDVILKQGKYQIKVPEGAEVTQKDEQALLVRANGDLEAGLDMIFQPDSPVKVGEAWGISFALLNKGFGPLGKLDPEKSKGSTRLIRVYDKEGKKFGVLEFNLELHYLNLDELPFDPPALFKINGTLDTAIDGSSCVGVLTTFSRLNGKAVISNGGAKVTLVIAREGSARKERFAIKK